MTELIPVFSDQLSPNLPSLQATDPKSAMILMVEVRHEADVVPHHRKKLIFIFSSMRHFAQELREQGWTVDYVELTDPDNTQSFDGEIERALDRHDVTRIRVTEPSEYRILETVEGWADAFDVPVTIMPDDRFICSKAEFARWAEGRKSLRMEYFYREMRRKTGLLMTQDEKPEGGEWNYDSENRKPPKDGMTPDPHFQRQLDNMTQAVIKMVEAEFPTRFGSTDDFFYAVTREAALESLDHFAQDLLGNFGDYQDAMVTGQPFLYHSILSAYINGGLLDPREVCQRVEKSYYDGDTPLNAAEGYIRQIIGWREYIRGIYWLKMPDYIDTNYLEADRDLPDFYWTGDTKMHCVREAVTQTAENAYAHHIQRLMITGNFAQLAGIDPFQVHEWYLAVYADAYEWVEVPNVIGMSQYADGGLLGSKPYVSSGAYINRMSNYCQSCDYKISKRVTEDACPFNALYWNFLDRNADKLKGNPRLGMPYRNLEKMDAEKRKALNARATSFLDGLEPAKSDYL